MMNLMMFVFLGMILGLLVLMNLFLVLVNLCMSDFGILIMLVMVSIGSLVEILVMKLKLFDLVICLMIL